MNDSKLKRAECKISPVVRARILYEREFNIDSRREKGFYDDNYFKGIVKQRDSTVAQRDALIKSMLLAILFMSFFVSGIEIKLPYFEISINSFPSIVYIVSVFLSFCFLMFAVNFVNEQAYMGLIDSYLISKYADKAVDYQTVRAAHITEHLFIRVFKDRFFDNEIYSVLEIKPKKIARIANFCCNFIVGTLFLLLILMSLGGFLLYVNVYHVESGIFGWIVRFVNLLLFVSSIFIIVIYGKSMTYTDEYIMSACQQAEG